MICGNCNQPHPTVDDVRRCYGYKDEPATVNQVNFGQTLYRQRVPDFTVVSELEKLDAELKINAMTKSEISRFIDQMKTNPYRTHELQVKAELTDGIYVFPKEKGIGVDIKVMKFYVGQNGILLAKELEVYSEAIWDGTRLVQPADKRWTYRGAAAKFAGGAQKLDKELAAKYGKIYGFCMICGRTLTDEESIAAGIGPVCAGKWAA